MACHLIYLDIRFPVSAVKDLKIIEEKEEALMALGNLAFNIGFVMIPSKAFSHFMLV